MSVQPEELVEAAALPVTQVPAIAKHPLVRLIPPVEDKNVEVAVVKFATPLMEKREPGVDVPKPTLLLPVIIKAGVDVPSSETTNEGEVEPISTERVAQGVVEAMPIAALPIPPEASDVEKTVRSGTESI